MIFNKRGLSGIVATLLLILATVAAASIIAGIIIPFVKENVGKGAQCFNVGKYYSFYNDEFDFEGSKYKFNCYTKTAKNHYVSIKAETLDNETADLIKGFYLVFIKGEERKAFEIYDGAVVDKLFLVNGLSSSTPNLKIPLQGAVKTYLFKADDLYDRVEVVTNLKDEECNMKNEIVFTECGSNIN